MMPNVYTTFEGQDAGFLNLDNNVASDLIFVTECFQTLLTSKADCTAAPTDVLAVVDSSMLNNVGADFLGHQQSGFVTDGRVVTGDFAILSATGSPLTWANCTSDAVFTAQQIVQDSWHFDSPVAGGSVSIARDSALINKLKDTSNNMSGFFLESGPIADQTFSNGTLTPNPTFFVGGSDYADIFDTTDRNVLTVQADTNGQYDLDFVGFGYSSWNTIAEPRVLLSGYYESLGYPNQP